MATMKEFIIDKILEQSNKLLIDYNLPSHSADRTRFTTSQFKAIYGTTAWATPASLSGSHSELGVLTKEITPDSDEIEVTWAVPQDMLAGVGTDGYVGNEFIRWTNLDGPGNSIKGVTRGVNASIPSTHAVGDTVRTTQNIAQYPLNSAGLANLAPFRLLKAIRIGFIPIKQLGDFDMPTMFIADATDEGIVEDEGYGIQHGNQAVLYSFNLRVATLQPKNATKEQSNIIVQARIKEGLRYVFDFGAFYNQRQPHQIVNGEISGIYGYTYPSRIVDVEIVHSSNLEELASPYEITDHRVEFIVEQQKIRGV